MILLEEMWEALIQDFFAGLRRTEYACYSTSVRQTPGHRKQIKRL